MARIIENMLIPLIAALALVVFLLVIRKSALNVFSRWRTKSKGKLDEGVVSALRGPSYLWIASLGIYVGINFSELPDRYLTIIEKIIYVVVVLSVTMAIANLSGTIFSAYVKRSNLPLPPTGLAHDVLKGFIFCIGILIILDVCGISIAPLLTALGVGGLAVALALQDTLSNLFAGIHILMEKSVRVGDFVKLETGQEGYVEDITWRTTRVRMLPNNMVVIPNSKLSQSVVTNYYLPEKPMSLLIPVSVGYSSDPDHVERILIEEAKKSVGSVQGLLADPEPFVRFIPGFGESALQFTLICRVAEFVDQFFAQHQLRKNILQRFRKEGIEIPFPQQTIHVRKERDEKS